MKVMKILLFIGLDPKGHDCVKVLKSGLVRARFCKQCLIFSILRIFHYCNKTCVNLLFVLLLMKFGKKRIESANPSQNLAHFFNLAQPTRRYLVEGAPFAMQYSASNPLHESFTRASNKQKNFDLSK